MSRFYNRFCKFLLVACAFGLSVSSAEAQISTTYGVLFETFTNSAQPCPGGANTFSSQVQSTLTSKGSEVVYLNHHVSNLQDIMAQAATGSDQTLQKLQNSTSSYYIYISAINRTSFSSGTVSPKLSGSESEWEGQIDNQAAMPRSADISIDSAFYDTTTYTFTAYLKITSDVQFVNTVGIRYAILQDNIHFAQCNNGPTTHNNVVRYISTADSVLALTNQPIGTTVHAMYTQRINQFGSDPTFKPADMKLVAFIQETTPSDYYVTTAATLVKNFAALPPPSKSLGIVSSVEDGQSYSPGANIIIDWTKANIKSVVTWFSSNNGSSWTPIDTVTDKQSFEYAFYTAPPVSTTTGKLRVTELGGSVVSTETGTFTITAAKDSFAIIRPITNEKDTTTHVLPIKWAQRGATSFTILFSKDFASTFDTIAKNVQTTFFNWTIPDSVATNGAYIQIIPSGASDLFEQEVGPFTIIKLINTGVVANKPSGVTGLTVYPNPGTQTATVHLKFSMLEPSTAEISVYDLLGREVAHSTIAQATAGPVDINLYTKNLVSGSYVVRVASAKGFTQSTRFEIQ